MRNLCVFGWERERKNYFLNYDLGKVRFKFLSVIFFRFLLYMSIEWRINQQSSERICSLCYCPIYKIFRHFSFEIGNITFIGYTSLNTKITIYNGWWMGYMLFLCKHLMSGNKNIDTQLVSSWNHTVQINLLMLYDVNTFTLFRFFFSLCWFPKYMRLWHHFRIFE